MKEKGKSDNRYLPHLAALLVTIIIWLVIININIVPVETSMYNEDVLYYTNNSQMSYFDAAKFGFSDTTHRAALPDYTMHTIIKEANLIVVAVISLIWLPIYLLFYFVAKRFITKPDYSQSEEPPREQNGNDGSARDAPPKLGVL
jgi:hypothetical protein